jgi:hypothetical protein
MQFFICRLSETIVDYGFHFFSLIVKGSPQMSSTAGWTVHAEHQNRIVHTRKPALGLFQPCFAVVVRSTKTLGLNSRNQFPISVGV